MFIGVLAAIALSLSTMQTSDTVQSLGENASPEQVNQVVNYSSLKVIDL